MYNAMLLFAFAAGYGLKPINFDSSLDAFFHCVVSVCLNVYPFEKCIELARIGNSLGKSISKIIIYVCLYNKIKYERCIKNIP